MSVQLKYKTCPNCSYESFLWREKCPRCNYIFKDTEENKNEPTTFTKNDEGKPRLFEFWEPEVHAAMARVMAHGADQYGKYNYRECKEPERFLNAALRHLGDAHEDVMALDDATGELHLTHALCNLVMVLTPLVKVKLA